MQLPQSGGKPCAAFLTAAADNLTSCCGCHAGKKSDPAFAAAVGGLECPFHLLCSSCFNCFLLLFYRCSGIFPVQNLQHN